MIHLRAPIARPLVIMSYPRSGSSMVASLFAAHGVWCGTCRKPDRHNPRGYFEHVGIGKLIGRTVGHSVHKGVCPDPPEGWPEMLANTLVDDGYTGGPWLYKASAVYWKLLAPFGPNWVIVTRPFEAMQQSGRKSGNYMPNRRSVIAHDAALAAVGELGAVTIDSEAVIAGDFSAVARALEQVGIKINETVARSVVEPLLWHERTVGA